MAGYYTIIRERWMLILALCLAGMISAAAIVISALNLANRNKTQDIEFVPSNQQTTSKIEVGPPVSRHPRPDPRLPGTLVTETRGPGAWRGRGGTVAEKIWTIAVGHDWGAMEYMNTTGFLRGFHMDLIREVCEAAGLTCRTVWEPYNKCWDSEPGEHSSGGKGPLSQRYDGCMGYVQTEGRRQVFDFSLPFLRDQPAMFFRKKGSRFSSRDLRWVNAIGFLDGWWTDEKCLARILNIRGTPLPARQVRPYPDPGSLGRGLLSGEVAGVFLPRAALPPEYSAGEEGWEALPGEFSCSSGGASLMVPRGSALLPAWNTGFQSLLSSGRYHKLCREAQETHGDGKILWPCV